MMIVYLLLMEGDDDMAEEKTIKESAIDLIDRLHKGNAVLHKELIENNLNSMGGLTHNCYEVQDAFERIEDSLATYRALVNKM